MWSESEIAAIAEDQADAAASRYAGVIDQNANAGNNQLRRLEELEMKVVDLESEVSRLRSENDMLRAEYGTHTHY